MAPIPKPTPASSSCAHAGEGPNTPHAPIAPPLDGTLRSLGEAGAFPLSAIGPTLASAAAALAAQTQAPAPLCAHHLLTLAAIAAQRRIAVRLPTGRTRPVACYFATLIDEGAPGCALAHMATEGLPIQDEERELLRAPRSCTINSRYGPPAPGEERKSTTFWTLPVYAPLKKTAPKVLAGRIEGGLFAGHPHDVVAAGPLRRADAARLCRRWDGSDPRAAPLSLHLAASPRTGRAFFADPDLADGGLLARFLCVVPAPNAGTRLWTAAETDAPPPALAALKTALGRAAPFAVNPAAPDRRAVPFAEPAQRAWLAFAQEMEAAVAPGGAFEAMRPFAERLAEHAARLAAVIAFTETPDLVSLSEHDLAGGIALARFYGAEALRLQAPGRLSPEQQLYQWLEQKFSGARVSLRDVCRSGPPALRDADKAYKLMRRLQKLGLVHPVKATYAGADAPRRAGETYHWRVGELSRDVA